MSEETPDYREEETPLVSETPGADAPMTTEAMAGLEEVKADPLADEATRQAAHERAMFERYVQEQGQQIPENFADAGAWFDSLKGAQAKYTQTQQEIANLKKQYEMADNTLNPDYKEPTAAVEAPAATEAEEPPLTELRIPEPEAVAEPAVEQAAPATGFTEADYARLSNEVATSGTLSEESRNELRTKVGFTEVMVNDFLQAQQAKREAAFVRASEVVGGGQKLSKMLRWAANNFKGEQLNALQMGLAGPSSELTLRGLASAYDAAHVSAEPSKKVNTVSAGTAQATTQLPGYKSMNEYSMDKSNPRYARDEKFRSAVDLRAARTDWRSIG